MANGHGGRREGAGRKPGALAKVSEEAIQKVRDSGLDLIEAYIAIYNNEKHSMEIRMKALENIAKHTLPTLKSIEISNNDPDEVIKKIELVIVESKDRGKQADGD